LKASTTDVSPPTARVARSDARLARAADASVAAAARSALMVSRRTVIG